LKPFEDDLIKLIENVKFRRSKDKFQPIKVTNSTLGGYERIFINIYIIIKYIQIYYPEKNIITEGNISPNPPSGGNDQFQIDSNDQRPISDIFG
jgi:hypothetical protein